MQKTPLENEIDQVFDHFLSPIKTLSDDLINEKPRVGNWTIGQLIRHVVLATAGLGDEKTKAADRPFDQLEPSIRETFLNSNEKFQSPEFITPEERTYHLDELLEDLKSNRDQLLKAIREKNLSELCLDVELPVWVHLTRFEWLKLIIYHVQRHTEQLKKLVLAQQESSV